jgi:ankyrin repeat protein
MLVKKLYSAIKDHNTSLVKKLLETNVNPNITLEEESPWGTLGDSIYELDEGGSIEVFILLLKFHTDVNTSHSGSSTALHSAIANGNIQRDTYIAIIFILLQYGANPNIWNPEFGTPLLMATKNNDYEVVDILLKYSAKFSNDNIYRGMCGCSCLHKAVHNKNISIILLLLDNGFDASLKDDANQLSEWYLDIKCNDLEKLKTLLNPNNPPYLKLGEKEEDKYIIYENKKTDDKNYEIYLLADKKSHKDKKYLYADNKIDAFVYWCFLNSLLSESITRSIQSHKEKIDKADYKNITKTISTILGEKITTDWFSSQGKEFATSYLTVIHWWYNLHTDFNRLYQDEEIKLPRGIQSQEEFDTLMKLLDIRYAQFKSGKDFNSNQNKEELEALIEGREAPKRIVDLSFLEESLSHQIDKSSAILPEDFLRE